MILTVLLILLVLVLLITWAKVHPFLSFLIVSIVAALFLGVNPANIGKSLEKGIGGILGSVFSVIILGAMLGKVIASTGAAQRISESLVALFGKKYLPWALALTGFIVGIPLFYNVGFILLIPLIYSLGQRYQLPLVYLAVALCASLSVTHGFLPPHPSPTALVPMMHADLGKTLVYGLIASIPVILVAGPLFAMTVRNIQGEPLASLKVRIFEAHEMPSSLKSYVAALLPVMMLAVGTWLTNIFENDTASYKLAALLSDANVVMLISLFVAYYLLGLSRGEKLSKLIPEGIEAAKDVFPILMIVAGAGVLKEIFTVAGLSDQIGNLVKTSSFSPLITGWFIAAVIRLSLGSATVAGLTAAGIIAPGIDPALVDPNLMVLAIGAGSLMFSHVNDTGFWMFKEYFNLNIRDTIKSWSLMETVVSVVGLGVVLIIDLFV